MKDDLDRTERAGALFLKAGPHKVPLTSLQLKTTQKLSSKVTAQGQ